MIFSAKIAFFNEIDKFGIGIEVCYKNKLNPQINLPFNFLIQKYFFIHNNPNQSKHSE